MPPSIDFVPDAQPVQTDQIDFQPDDVGQDYRPPSAVSGPAPTVPQPSTPQSLGFFRPFSTDLPEPEGKLGPLQTAGEMAASVPRAIGVATGVAGKGIEAGIGRVFGTGDTLEDIRASVERGEPLPVEKAAAKVPGIGGALLRGGLGIAETVPKLAAMSLFPQGIIAQSVAAGGLFGLDQQGNFSLKGAAIGALLPGSGALAKAGVARAITKGIAAGSTTLANPTAQWLLEEMGQQAALNAVMLAADSPEIIAQYRNDPAMARNTVQDIVGQNLAWALFGGVRHFVGGRPTATEAFIRKNAEKYGDAADAILKRRISKTGFKGIGRDEITEMLERQVKRTAEKPPEAEPAEEVQPPFIPVTPAAPTEVPAVERTPEYASTQPISKSVGVRSEGGEVGAQAPLRQQGEAPPLRPQEGEGQAPTPTSPPEPVAKPKVSPDDLVPMVEINGKPVAAGPDDITHADILKRAGLDPESIPHEDPRRRFINPKTGEQYTRLEAEAATGLKGTADAGGLDSTDLPRAKAAEERLPEVKPLSQSERDFAEVLAKKYGAPVAPTVPAEEPYESLSRFSNMLERAADASKDEAELERILSAAEGKLDESRIAWAIANNPHSSDATFSKAKANSALRQMTTDENIARLDARRAELRKAPSPAAPTGEAPPAAPAAGKTEAVPPATPEGTAEPATVKGKAGEAERQDEGKVWVWDRNTYTLKQAKVENVETSELDQYKTTKVQTDQGTFLAADVFSEKPTIKETKDEFGVIKDAEGKPFDAVAWRKQNPIQIGSPVTTERPTTVPKKSPSKKAVSDLANQLYNQHIKDTLGKPQYGLDTFIKMAERQLAEESPTPPPAAETKGEVAPAVAKAQRQVKKVAATEGQRPAKEVKSELVSRIEDEIDKAIDESKVNLEQDPDNPNQYTARGPNSARYAEVEKTKGGKFAVTSGKAGYGSAGTVKATFDTMEEAKWFMKGLVAEGEGNATVRIPGDGTFQIVRRGENLIDLWKKAQRIDVKSEGEPPVIPTGDRGKVDADEIVASAKKLYGDNDKAIAGIERQLASEQEMEPGQRDLLERAIQVLREDTPEFKRQKRIDELKQSIEDNQRDIETATKRIAAVKSEMKSASGTIKQRNLIRDTERNIARAQKELVSQKAEYDRLLEASQPTPAAPAPGTKTEMSELERIAAKVDRNETLTPAERKKWDAAHTKPEETKPEVQAGEGEVTPDQAKTISQVEKRREIESRGDVTAQLPEEQIWQRLGERGITRGGAVDLVNNPQGPAGRLLFDPKTGKPLSIQLNQAKIGTIEGLDWTLEHEAAHWFDIENQDMRAKLQGALSDAEFMSILDHVQKLGYGEDVIADEITARGIQRLANQWKNRTWFEKLVGNIQRFAAEKLGFKMTRKAAESAAIRALAQGLELVRGAAPSDVLPEAKAGPEAKAAEGPPTDLSDEEIELKRRQFGGMPNVGPEYTPTKIAEVDASVHRTFNPEDGVNPANDQKAAEIWEKFTNPTTRTQAASDLANSTMERGSASMLFVNLWRHAINQLLQNKDTRLFYDMIQRSEEFETREFVNFGPVGGNATGLDLRLRQEMIRGSFGRMKKYVEQQFAAAGRSLGEGPEVISNLVEEFKKISDRLDPDEWANIIWTGKDSSGRTLQDILDSFGPERKAAEEIVAQIPKEAIEPAQKKTIIGTVHEWLKREVVDSPADHAQFTDSLYNRLLDRFTLTEAQAREIADQTWERRIRGLGRETERMLDDELRRLDNLAERTADAFIRRIDQAEWKKEPKPNIIRDIIREALKKWDYPDTGRIFRQSVVPHGTDTYANDWIATLSGVLEANGLTKDKADELAHAVWTKKQNDYATANSRAMARASQSKSLKSLIESIRTSPYLDQQNPEWMRQTAERWFQSSGLSPIHATAAAKLFVDQWRKAYQNAQIRVAEQVLKNPKQNIAKLVQAIRSGLLDPGRQWPEELAKRSAFRPLTIDQLRKIAELEKKLSEETSPAIKAAAVEQMMGIMRHTNSPDFMRLMGESFAASLLSGVRTLTLNFVQPWFSLGAAWATHGIASPRDFPMLTRAMYEFAKSAWPQARFAWQKDAYSYQSSANVFHHNQLKRVYEQAQRDWKEGRYAKAALEFAFGWQQYVIRGLQTADQVGVAMAQQWKMALYGSMAMREARFSTKQISELVDVAVAKRRSEAEVALAAGYSPTEAAVIADEKATQAMQEFFENKVGHDKAVAIREAAVYDAFLNVGRRPLTIEGVKPILESDEGFLTRYLGINWVMQQVSKARGESGGASILTISAVGFMNVPLRTARFYAGFGPYGFLRWGIDKYRTGRGMDPLWKQSFANELQAKARLREAVAGTAAMLGILGWQFNNQTSDDDVEKRAFAMYVTGHGPTRKTLRDAWTKRGFEPYTFHVVIDGKVRSKLPITRTGQVLSFAMGAAAAIDDVSWRRKQEIADHGVAKPIAGRELLAAIGTYYEIIGAQGVFQAFGRISQLRQGDMGTARAVGILASSTSSALLIPGKSLIQWMENMIYSPVDRSSIATSMMANFPVLNAIYNGRAVNRFGDVLGDRTWSAKIGQSGIPIVFRVQDTTQNKALYQMLVDKGASPTELLRSNLEEKYGPLTQDQWLRFAKVSGESLKSAVVANLPQLQSLPPQAVRQFMAGASEAANAQAAVTLGLTQVAGGGVASTSTGGGGGSSASALSLPRPPRLALPGPPSIGPVGGGRVPTAGAGSRSSSVLLPETAPAVYAPQVATGGFRRSVGMPRRSRLSYAAIRQPRLVSGRLRARSGRIRRVRLSRPRRHRISYKG